MANAIAGFKSKIQDMVSKDSVREFRKRLFGVFMGVLGLIMIKRGRIFLAAISILILFGILIYVLRGVIDASGPEYIFRDKPFNELTKAGVDIRLDQSRNLFQIGILILGAIWGLLIAKKGEAALVFKDYQEVIMTVCASILLCASLICHTLYISRITEIYSDAGEIAGKQAQIASSGHLQQSIPDIFEPNINYMFVSQALFLVSGVIVALITFVSAHKLKEG
jgi:hypothetical protein